MSKALLSVAFIQSSWHIIHDQKILCALFAGFPAHQHLVKQGRSANASLLFAVQAYASDHRMLRRLLWAAMQDHDVQVCPPRSCNEFG
jgi:hypothetical protein